MAISATVNGRPAQLDGPPDMPYYGLARPARHDGHKVRVQYRPIRCIHPADQRRAGQVLACLQSGEIDGAITAIEGIGETEEGRGIHSFWLSLEVLQCGYRQCGQIKPLSLFLPATRSPTMRPLTLRCPLFGRFISRRSLAIPRFNCGPGAQPRLCWQMLLSSVRHSST